MTKNQLYSDLRAIYQEMDNLVDYVEDKRRDIADLVCGILNELDAGDAEWVEIEPDEPVLVFECIKCKKKYSAFKKYYICSYCAKSLGYVDKASILDASET